MSSPNDKNSNAAIFGGYNNGFGYAGSFGTYMGMQQPMSAMPYIHQPHLHHPGPYRPMNHHQPQLPPQPSQSPQPQSQSPTPQAVQQPKSPVPSSASPSNSGKGGNNNNATATTTTATTPATSAGNNNSSAASKEEGAEDASNNNNSNNEVEGDAGERTEEGETVEGDGSSAEEEVSIKILVPNNMVGSIIGKGGATIKDITVQTKAKIHIAQGDDSLERVVTITGSLPSVSQAQCQISLKMQEESYSEIKDFESELPPAKRMSLIPMKLLVPNAVVGRLIGKGGANLKKTMAETDTFIMCSKEDEVTRFTGDRTVSVVGNVENQTKAQASITQQVKLYLQSQAPVAPMLAPKDKGPIHYDQGFVGLIRNGQRGGMENFTYPFPRAVPIPAAYPLPVPFRVAPELQDHEDTVVVQVPNGVVGSIIGKGGATIKDIASRSRTTIRVAKNDEADANGAEKTANRAVSIMGTLESIFKAQSMIFAKIAEAPPAIGGGADQPFRVELSIPNEMVGRIIGKKGSQVKKITEVSGARLTINQEEVEEGGEQPPSTIVTVTGRLESNLLAQHLIQEILFYHQTPQE